MGNRLKALSYENLVAWSLDEVSSVIIIVLVLQPHFEWMRNLRVSRRVRLYTQLFRIAGWGEVRDIPCYIRHAEDENVTRTCILRRGRIMEDQ